MQLWIDKPCNVGEYLVYKKSKCRKKLVDKLAEECSENIDGNEIIYNEILVKYILHYLSLLF